jgi:hypothetical protein
VPDHGQCGNAHSRGTAGAVRHGEVREREIAGEQCYAAAQLSDPHALPPGLAFGEPDGGSSGASSTPQRFDSITAALEILG